MKMEDMMELQEEKNYAIQAARELFYPETVVDRIVQAKTKYEIDRILIQARHAC